MASVVGKTIFSDGKGKLFFGYYKTDDAVEFVDYKTWKKLSFKDVSKGDTNKERVIKAIVKNQKQFNWKVDFNMWAKKQRRSFEDTMDWFIQKGWINNVTKRGIKESVDVLSVNEAKLKPKKLTQLKKGEKFVFNNKPFEFISLYSDIKDAAKVKTQDGKTSVVSFGGGMVNKNTKGGFSDYLKQGGRVWDNVNMNGESVNEAMKPSQVRSAISKVKKGLMRKWKQKGGYENFGQKELSQMKDKFDYNPYGSPDERQISKMLDGFDDWAMNYDGNMREGKKRFKRQDGIGKAKYTISYHDGKKKHKDGSDFFDIKIFKNKKDLSDFVGSLVKQGYKLTNESVNEDRNSNMFYVLYQKKGVFGKPAAAGYKDRKDAEKFAKSLGNNHNTMILDKQSMKNVKGVDVNESASKEAMGIAGFTGTRGSAVEDFITKNELNGKKLFQYVKKGGLKQRMEFVSAIAGKPGNKIQKMIISKFKLGESVNEAKFGYKTSTASYIKKHKDEYKQAEKMNNGNEKRFYDLLQQMEDKVGHPKTMLFISNALRGYGVDMYKDPKIKNPQDAQEALFLLSK
jgi:DNA-binding winged helix-turn-helix (wHTH) protein